MPHPFHAIAILALALILAAPPVPAQQQGQGQDQPPPAVTVVTLRAQDITVTSTLPGRIVASGVAEVRPQVAGIITERLFTEGGEVAVGDALYRIDAASYEAKVAAARAAVAQAEANLRASRKEADRLQTLLDRNVTSQQNLDDATAARDAAEAALQVAEAELRTAEIDLQRTTIRAPLSGTVGRSLTTRGALVTAGQAEPLAVIRTLDPVYVDVTMSAAELIAWRRGSLESKLGKVDPTVTLRLPDGGGYDHTGQLTAAEPHVEEQTGVVFLRMEFPNPDGFLLPGMYAQVELPKDVIEGAILAPQEAVGRDRRGRPTAMVVTPDNIVESRVLSVQGDRGSDWIVTDGLADGDRIIVAGLQKVAPGARVTPEERSGETAPRN